MNYSVCDLKPVELRNVGKIVASSKRRYTWKFRLHNN